MAFSLGYPHPDIMLSMMTFTQLRELQMYLGRKASRHEELQQQAEESRLRHFFSRVIAQQSKEGKHG